jgi:hypothetical protein
MRNASPLISCVISLMTATILAVSAMAEEVPLRQVPNFLPADTERLLVEGELELFSIDPAFLTDKQRRRVGTKVFHGYKVLGGTKITRGPQRDQLLHALQEAIANSPLYYVYCFDPMHAIRASVGARTVDLLISFHCERIEVYSPEKSLVATNATARPILDAALKRAGVPLGKRP